MDETTLPSDDISDADLPVERWVELAKAVRSRGDHLLATDLATKGLSAYPHEPPLLHLQILSLADCGAIEKAAAEYRRYFVRGARYEHITTGSLTSPLDVDIACLGARIEKEFAHRRMHRGAGKRTYALAARRYESAFRRAFENPYPGVNAASLWILAGSNEKAKSIAKEVLERCTTMEAQLKSPDAKSESSPIDPYYLAASRAEAHLVLGEMRLVKETLEVAAKHCVHGRARMSRTRAQLDIVLKQLVEDGGVEEEPDLFKDFNVGMVIHYCGHIFSPDGSQGERVAGEIETILAEHKVALGFGALAAGSDIMVAEALLARGGELHVVLPFQSADFAECSVAPFGSEWEQRFHGCMDQASTIEVATEDGDMRDDILFEYGGRLAMGRAILRARRLATNVMQLAIFDGKPATGRAGTAAEVKYWGENIEGKRPEHGKTRVVPFNREASFAKTPPARPAIKLGPGVGREFRCMVFGDLKGFSKLRESQLHVFQTEVLGALGRVIKKFKKEHNSVIEESNTWGDAVYLVLNNASLAAECATQLQEATKEVEWKDIGFETPLQIRMAVHFGPIFTGIDPIRRQKNFFGTQVTRAARVEPITQPGEVYVTEAFAAQLYIEDPKESLVCEYEGRVDLAKDYAAKFPLYRLRRK